MARMMNCRLQWVQCGLVTSVTETVSASRRSSKASVTWVTALVSHSLHRTMALSAFSVSIYKSRFLIPKNSSRNLVFSVALPVFQSWRLKRACTTRTSRSRQKYMSLKRWFSWLQLRCWETNVSWTSSVTFEWPIVPATRDSVSVRMDTFSTDDIPA